MNKGSAGKAILRKDYTPYPWTLQQVTLRFEIGEHATRVISQLEFARADGAGSGPLELDGQEMELISVSVNGSTLGAEAYTKDSAKLVLHEAPAHCLLELEVEITPSSNTALEGLYPSGDFLLTQCEPEGFRKITYFPDRPDVMTRYDVTIVADRERYPVLLSNGNLVEAGESDGGRHWVRWVDPFAKPSYLFALVAGDLACVEDHFTTRGGREVALRIYVEHENAGKCEHAMASLVNAMVWDEERFDLEYDLDVYNIVATNDFNMGAMENKSLNIFNSKYVLASPETATDMDYQGIESVIGHEYFHNWTGNRVTCRDWFQLTLKEGLTVFRDQEFSSDLQSRAVKRIRDVRVLRDRQFPEDCGPMSHPIRPDKYLEINNFYTMTVYQKGAEIIRMVHTILGEDGFQAGVKLYFDRHDGQAVTCDDFLAAMADANGVSLERLGRWYGQSGTPEVTARGEFDDASGTFTLVLSQRTPPTQDQQEKAPVFIPIAMGLVSRDGEQLPLQLAGEDEPAGFSRVLVLNGEEQRFTFTNLPAQPVPSLLRGFSAPVKLDYPYQAGELVTLMAHDNDSFVRWEAAQLLAQRVILENVRRLAAGRQAELPPGLQAAFESLLSDTDSDPALISEALKLPGEEYLADQMDEVDVDGIHAAREFVKSGLAAALEGAFRARYESLSSKSVYDKSSASMARRSLRNVCLAYLLETAGGALIAEAQMASADNMTDTLAALQGLAWSGAAGAPAALAEFESKWNGDALVMDKWFSIQATVPGQDTIEQVRSLLDHPEFSLHNPNKVRSLVGAFSMLNPTAFHAANGAGYRLHADLVIVLDALNPQMAARMATAFNAWTRYDAGRRELMEKELKRIEATGKLSPDLAEIVGNALAMNPRGQAS